MISQEVISQDLIPQSGNTARRVCESWAPFALSADHGSSGLSFAYAGSSMTSRTQGDSSKTLLVFLSRVWARSLAFAAASFAS